jgi:hypothetical protein
MKNIKVGTHVYWKNPKKSNKSEDSYIGPFVIKQINDDRTIKIASKVQEFDTVVQFIKLAEKTTLKHEEIPLYEEFINMRNYETLDSDVDDENEDPDYIDDDEDSEDFEF